MPAIRLFRSGSEVSITLHIDGNLARSAMVLPQRPQDVGGVTRGLDWKIHGSFWNQIDWNQFDFRKERSSDNAVKALPNQLVSVCDLRKLAFAVDLNIQNDFNSMDLGVISTVLVRLKFSAHLHRILESYLRGRVLHLCNDSQGFLITIEPITINRGVLKTLSWGRFCGTCDAGLQLPLSQESISIGYADNTRRQ